LFRAKPQRREDSVLESFCDFAFLREPHFRDYSEGSNLYFVVKVRKAPRVLLSFILKLIAVLGALVVKKCKII